MNPQLEREKAGRHPKKVRHGTSLILPRSVKVSTRKKVTVLAEYPSKTTAMDSSQDPR